MRAGCEQAPHVRQAAGPVDGMERFQMVVGDRQRDVRITERLDDAPDGAGVRRDQVGRHGEDRLAEVAEHRRQPGQRRARHLVRDHDHSGRQVRRRLPGAAHGQADHGEDAAEKGEVALQQRVAAEAQAALVQPHAPRLAAGEQYPDAYRVLVCRRRGHGEDGV